MESHTWCNGKVIVTISPKLGADAPVVYPGEEAPSAILLFKANSGILQEERSFLI